MLWHPNEGNDSREIPTRGRFRRIRTNTEPHSASHFGFPITFRFRHSAHRFFCAKLTARRVAAETVRRGRGEGKLPPVRPGKWRRSRWRSTSMSFRRASAPARARTRRSVRFIVLAYNAISEQSRREPVRQAAVELSACYDPPDHHHTARRFLGPERSSADNATALYAKRHQTMRLSPPLARIASMATEVRVNGAR